MAKSENQMTVYVLTTGAYSDYGIVAIFSSEEKAVQFKKDYPKNEYGGYNDIEEYDLDNPGDRYIKGRRPFSVSMYRNGDSEGMEFSGVPGGEDIDYRVYRFGGREICYFYNVWADSSQHALKIVNERKAQLIASGEWDRLLAEWTNKRGYS